MPELMQAIIDLATSLPTHLILLSVLSIFAAAILRGFTGFGFALAAVPLLGMFLSPKHAVPIAIMLQLLGSVFDFRSSASTCHWPSLRWLMVGAAIGLPIGVIIMIRIPEPVSRLVISSITLLAVVMLSKGYNLAVVPGRAMTSAVGFVAGIFNGLAAMPGPPAVAYYMSIPMSREGARSSLIMFFLMTSIVALAASVAVNLITVEVITLSLIGLPAVWAGTRLGELGFKHGSAQLHRRLSITTLGVLSLISAIKGLEELF